MKLPSLLTATAVLFFHTVRAADENPVRMIVKQESKSDTDGFKKTQRRALKITLTNTGPDSLPLRVKYAFFGRDAKKPRETVVVDHSDMTTQLQPKSEQTLTTTAQKAELIDEHYEKDKKIEASGQKFTGWGVKVYHEGKVIAEACEPSSMLDELAKMPGLPGPKPKPAAAPAPAKPAPKPAPKPASAAPASTTS